MHVGGGEGGFHSSGGRIHTQGSSTRSFSNPGINHPVVTHNPNNDNHQHHHDNHNQYNRGPGGSWWFGGPTYVNSGYGGWNTGGCFCCVQCR